MGIIEARQRVMYWAPTRRRHYATLKQACWAEAGAKLKHKYRDEDGHWTDIPRLHVVRARVARRLEAAARRTGQGGGE